MTYMTAMDRLEMRCIFFFEGLRGAGEGLGARLGHAGRPPCAPGSAWHHPLPSQLRQPRPTPGLGTYSLSSV